jgi:hypothetical protein
VPGLFWEWCRNRREQASCPVISGLTEMRARLAIRASVYDVGCRMARIGLKLGGASGREPDVGDARFAGVGCRRSMH